MDLRLFGRVLWRFRKIMVAGFVVAVLLSFLTIAKLDISHGPRLVLRSPPLYQASASLLVTQTGFPWGSAVQPYSPTSQNNSPVPRGDFDRLTQLANLYVTIANGDQVAGVVARATPRDVLPRTIPPVSAVQGYSVSPTGYKSPLPTIVINGTAASPRAALLTASAGVQTLKAYLDQAQDAARIPVNNRVVFQEIKAPSKKTILVVNPTKKTLPIVVFLTIMLAVTALAFVLENLRPSVPRPVPLNTEAEQRPESKRRSA